MAAESEVRPTRVLVVEDEPDLLEAMVGYLELEGFAAAGAGTVSAANEWMAAHEVDMVVLDLGLPDQDGITWLKNLGGLRDKGIVMATARGKLDDRLAGLDAGADAYLVKPVDLEELVAVVRNVAARMAERREAERARGEQARFMAAVSHEIRNPVTAMLGAAKLLSDAPGEERPELIEGLRSSGELLRAITTDVLELSRMEAGRFTLQPSIVDIGATVCETVELLRALAEGKGTVLACTVAASLPRVWCDRLRLQQVVMNLVGNAIKFTDHGTVVVETRLAREEEQTAHLEVSVTDTGCGMAPAEVAGLFEPFTQMGATADQRSGSGLGLTIANQIVQAMGGRIEVRSSVGEGSRFRLILPLRVAGLTDGRVKPLSVLLVDDERESVASVEAFLREQGHAVDAVQSGPAALVALKRKRFDLVLVDVSMPVIGGMEITRRMRRSADPRQAQAVVFGLITEHDDDEACKAEGMDEVLRKPVVLERLKAGILERFGTAAVTLPETPATQARLTRWLAAGWRRLRDSLGGWFRRAR